MSSAARMGQGRRPGQAADGDRPDRPGGFCRRHRTVLWLVPVILVAAAAVVLAALAASYQPLAGGSSGGGSFPGLRTGAGLRWLRGGPSEQLYVPPQRGTFALGGSVDNDGSWPVTIVGVFQAAGSPFTAAGQAVYISGQDPNPLQPRVRVLHDLRLGPGQSIEVGMPLRTPYCAYRRPDIGVPSFLIKERFLVFTRIVAIPYLPDGSPVVTNAPGSRAGAPGTFCASR
jgi:hypothetical protein